MASRRAWCHCLRSSILGSRSGLRLAAVQGGLLRRKLGPSHVRLAVQTLGGELDEVGLAVDQVKSFAGLVRDGAETVAVLVHQICEKDIVGAIGLLIRAVFR